MVETRHRGVEHARPDDGQEDEGQVTAVEDERDHRNVAPEPPLFLEIQDDAYPCDHDVKGEISRVEDFADRQPGQFLHEQDAGLAAEQPLLEADEGGVQVRAGEHAIQLAGLPIQAGIKQDGIEVPQEADDAVSRPPRARPDQRLDGEKVNDVPRQETVPQLRRAPIEEEDQQADDHQVGLRRVVNERVVLEAEERPRRRVAAGPGASEPSVLFIPGDRPCDTFAEAGGGGELEVAPDQVRGADPAGRLHLPELLAAEDVRLARGARQ